MEEANIVNLTPHAITMISHRSFIYKDMEPHIILRIPPSGKVARCSQKTTLKKQISFQGITLDITNVLIDKVYHLPEPIEGTYYIVSKLVAEHLKGRGDLLVTHGIYKQDNKTIGARSFTIW